MSGATIEITVKVKKNGKIKVQRLKIGATEEEISKGSTIIKRAKRQIVSRINWDWKVDEETR